jgi:cytochrome c553
MPPRSTAAARWLTGALLCSAGLVRAALAQAQPPAQAEHQDRLRLRALAATCAQCHGTDGHAVAGEALVRLAGLPQARLLSQLMAFRSGERQATVMDQIARGYTPEQLAALAAYFAARP